MCLCDECSCRSAVGYGMIEFGDLSELGRVDLMFAFVRAWWCVWCVGCVGGDIGGLFGCECSGGVARLGERWWGKGCRLRAVDEKVGGLVVEV